ncbi:hypothetical protein FKM82_014842 [Ascaphus truei]
MRCQMPTLHFILCTGDRIEVNMMPRGQVAHSSAPTQGMPLVPALLNPDCKLFWSAVHKGAHADHRSTLRACSGSHFMMRNTN